MYIIKTLKIKASLKIEVSPYSINTHVVRHATETARLKEIFYR